MENPFPPVKKSACLFRLGYGKIQQKKSMQAFVKA
jgi:hypothetical protein